MNWTGIQVETAAIVEPVTAAQVRDQLRQDETAQDTMIDLLITAAREGVEKYLGRTLNTTTYNIFYDDFPTTIELPRPPYQSVTHVKYYDSDGVQQTLTAVTDYQTDLISEPARIEAAYGTTWPTSRAILNAVEVRYVAGYGDAADDVPQPIRQLVTAIAVDLFEHPEMNIELRISENPAYRFLAVNYKICNVW
jgi:uncharacterized phiE125 gp8 family phage protein